MTYTIQLIWLGVLGITTLTAKINREQEALGNPLSDIKLKIKQGKLYKLDLSNLLKELDDYNHSVQSPRISTGKSLFPKYRPHQDRKPDLSDDGSTYTSMRDEGASVVQKPKVERDEPERDSQGEKARLGNNRSDVKRGNVGNTYFQLRQKYLARQFLRKVLAKAGNSSSKKTSDTSKTTDKTKVQTLLNRRKRWEDYDRNYDWENGGADNHAPESQERKETKLEKWAKNWQKHALRFIFIFSFVMMFVCCCCAGCKKFFGRLCEIIMMHLREWRDLCLNRDPTYRMMRKHADEYGIQLDYEEYKRIKNIYDESLKKHGYSSVDLSGRK